MNRGIKNAPRSPASREIKPSDHLCHVIVTIPFVESVSLAWIGYGRAYNQVSSHCGFLPCSSVLPSIGVRFERPNQGGLVAGSGPRSALFTRQLGRNGDRQRAGSGKGV